MVSTQIDFLQHDGTKLFANRSFLSEARQMASDTESFVGRHSYLSEFFKHVLSTVTSKRLLQLWYVTSLWCRDSTGR